MTIGGSKILSPGVARRLCAALLPLCLLAATPSVPAAAATLAGRVTVTDGDTLKLAGQRIRLYGIDAPEKAQSCERGGVAWRCGLAATQRMRALVRGSWVTCTPKDRDRYGRIVATCRANGVDVGGALVADGLALAYRRYSHDYVGAEVKAKAAHAGMWAGRFVPPWDWRRGRRLVRAGATATPAANDNRACRIKGNISRNGARIYHVPGDPDYARTRIDTAKGERWFCTETQARTAGWRPPRR